MFIDRNEQGHIVGVYANQQQEGQEYVEGAQLWTAPSMETKLQIARLESQQLMPRATREFMLLSMESMFTAEQLALNPGYVAVKAFDSDIANLRAQL